MRNLSRFLSLFALALSASACTIEFIDQDDDDDPQPFDGGSFWPDAQELDGGGLPDAWQSNIDGGGEICGDGLVQPLLPWAEVCDDANTISGDGCSADCRSTEICGNAVVDTASGEQCDDGNQVNNDGCSNACLLPSGQTCGNGAVEGSEQCDNGLPGVNTALCDRDCTLATCGDALVNFTAGEQCDTGGASASCDADCTAVVCGDGLVNPVANEQCDDGNFDDLDGCHNDCTLP